MDYKSVFTNLCLELQQNRSWIKGLGKNPFTHSIPFTHSLTAVPFVRGHRSVFPRTPRIKSAPYRDICPQAGLWFRLIHPHSCQQSHTSGWFLCNDGCYSRNSHCFHKRQAKLWNNRNGRVIVGQTPVCINVMERKYGQMGGLKLVYLGKMSVNANVCII